MGIITLTKQGSITSQAETGQLISHAVAFEDCDDPLDEVGVLLQRFNDRLTFANLALAKRYSDGNLNIVIEAKWGSIDFDIIFQREDGTETSRYPANSHELGPWGRTSYSEVAIWQNEKERHLHGSQYLQSSGCHWNDARVFVENVEPMEIPERVIPSFVWFKAADEPIGVSADALYFGYGSGFKFFLGNRKPVRTSVCRLVFSPNQIADQVVESRAQIVDDIPDNPTHLDWQTFLDTNTHDILSGLRVFISNDFIGICCEERLRNRLKLLNVAFGPFNF